MGERVDLDTVRIDAHVALSVPEVFAVRRRVLPFGVDGESAYVACEDPDDRALVESLERILRKRVVLLAADGDSLDRALRRIYVHQDEGRSDDAIGLLETIMHAALLEGASDVHVEPDGTGARVRFRVDGVLEAVRAVPADGVPALLNRIKVLGGMDIAEKRLPQDGRFTWRYGPAGEERSIDVRAAVLPTKFGERATLRLLALHAADLTLSRLGMLPADLSAFERAVASPFGLVLLTGPTGSGKTTTLYAALRSLDLERLNVLTIEDPVEYDVAGASQVEVDADDRISFSRALRSVLRHDPDVLMIGEIRDLDTAETAVRAALTGHLVLSTLHTNSAAGAVTRLVDMGVPRYLVAATLRLAAAQRLVRRLCVQCRKPRPLAFVEAAALGVPGSAGALVYDPAGCVYCKHTGHAGRSGIFECFAPSKEDAEAISRGADEAALSTVLHAGGSSLRGAAVAAVLAGTISPGDAVQAVEVT